MSDILDTIFAKKYYQNKQFALKVRKKLFFSQQNKNTDEFKFSFKNLFSRPSKFQVFHQIDQVFTIIMINEQYGNQISIIFKLLKGSQIFRIQSIYLRIYFIGQFLRTSASVLLPRLNPLTGQIFIQFQCLMSSLVQRNTYLKNLLFNIKQKKSTIQKFWKQVVEVCEGNYGLEQNSIIRQKVDDFIMMSKLSKREKQGQSVHSLRHHISSVQRVPQQICSQMQSFIKLALKKLPQKAHKSVWQYKKQYQQINKQKKILQQNNIRPVINYKIIQNLIISDKQKQIITRRIAQCKNQDLDPFRVVDKQFGKMFLQFQINLNQRVDKFLKQLDHIDQTQQFNFLNYYFLLNDATNKVLFKMALKKCTFYQHFQRNLNSMSFQTKLKIFLKIFYAVQLLWQKFGIFTGEFDFSSISITKTLIVKIQNIQSWHLFQGQHNQKSDYDRYLNKNQTMIRLHSIFHLMFYQKPLHCMRPSREIPSKFIVQNQRHSQTVKNQVDQRIKDKHLYGVPEILNSISYCFKEYQHFQLIQDQYANETEKFHHLAQIRKKTKIGNFDLVLGTIFRCLQVVKLVS